MLALLAKEDDVGGGVFYKLPLWAALTLHAVGSGTAAMKADSLAGERFIGAAGCQSSGCHGGAGEKRSQYLTWANQDFHARAYAVLVGARSARMAETLGLPSAQSNARCTVCHSPFQSVASSHLASRAQPDEGVSCESCHGAASSWLRGHTRKDWSYATRVGAGMRDLRSFYVRANTCVACHQNLDTDLLAAGHPELIFELDGQSVAEPKHWRDEDRWSGARGWLVGQSVALRETSWRLAQNEKPEPEAKVRWEALVWLLVKTTANQKWLPMIDSFDGTASPTVFSKAQKQADSLARQAAIAPWDNRHATAILQNLAATESEFLPSPTASSELLFDRARRLTMALDRLVRAVEQPKGEASLSALLEDVRRREDFQPAKFAADLGSFRKTRRYAPP